MNRLMVLCAAIVALCGTLYALQDGGDKEITQKPLAEKPKPKTDDDGINFTDRASYAHGTNVGQYLQTLKEFYLKRKYIKQYT